MLKNATSIDDVSYEDVIDLRTLADWLRGFADPDLYEDEDYPSDELTEAVAAIIAMLAEMGYHQTTNGPAWTWDVLADQLQEFGDNYGAALIRHSYWLEYVQEYASDAGPEGAPTGWPYNHIDWQAAADELEQDWGRVSLGDVEFLVRSF